MNIAIIYATKHGTTAKVSQKIANKFRAENVEVFNLKTDKNIDLQVFDVVILGTAIYAGTPLKTMKKFCESQSAVLLEKRLALFVCGMEQDTEKQQREIANAFSQNLRENAVILQFLGGEFLFEKMNFLEKMIIKKIAKTDKNVSAIKEEKMEEFVRKMKV